MLSGVTDTCLILKGTRNLADLAMNMPGLRVFVHISTAYVNGNLPPGTLVREQLYPLRTADGKPIDHIALAERLMKFPAADAASEVLTQPSTYCMSHVVAGKGLVYTISSKVLEFAAPAGRGAATALEVPKLLLLHQGADRAPPRRLPCQGDAGSSGAAQHYWRPRRVPLSGIHRECRGRDWLRHGSGNWCAWCLADAHDVL